MKTHFFFKWNIAYGLSSIWFIMIGIICMLGDKEEEYNIIHQLVIYILTCCIIISLIGAHLLDISFNGAYPYMIKTPPRPIFIRIFNCIFSLPMLRNLSIFNLDMQTILMEAQHRTGLSDYGDCSIFDFRIALSKLLFAMKHEAELNPFGIVMQRERMLTILCNRLQLEEQFKKHPEILEQILWPIVIVIGLQRTGTTALHRLLSSNINFQPLITYEAVNPAIKNIINHEQDKLQRIKAADMNTRALAYLAPHFFAIHACLANEAEEDVMLMEYSFLSQVPEATMHVPSYSKWLEKQDFRHSYVYMKRILLALQYQHQLENTHKDRLWLLKTPAHMEYLSEFMDIFPESKVIHTHRSPQQCMVSFASMVGHSYGIFSDNIDPEKLAIHWLNKNSRMTIKSIEYRKNHEDLFCDVKYDDMIMNWEKEIIKIYKFLNIPYTTSVMNQVNNTMKQNKQHKYGRHIYDANVFGKALTSDKLNSAFKQYYSRYNNVV